MHREAHALRFLRAGRLGRRLAVRKLLSSAAMAPHRSVVQARRAEVVEVVVAIPSTLTEARRVPPRYT